MCGAQAPEESRSEPTVEAGFGSDTGLIAISRGGAELAGRLASALSCNVTLHVADRYAETVSSNFSCTVETFPLPLRPVIEEAFHRYSRLVLFAPVGVAVRLLAPLLQHKHRDPAVVCVDDAGRFAVSLISGHVGGADELASRVSDILGGTAVITSASHVMETLAVDLLGQEFGWQLDADSTTVTRVSAAVVNGEPVGIYQETGENKWWPNGTKLPANLRRFSSMDELLHSHCRAAIVITDRTDALGTEDTSSRASTYEPVPTVVLRPRSLIVGMGCRRGVEREHLENLFTATLRENGLSPKSVKCIATADIKSDEPGILELAERYGAPVVCFGSEQLNSVFEEGAAAGHGVNTGDEAISEKGEPSPSPVAHRLLGVWGVAEPAALLSSGADRLLVSREKTDRATIAIARIPFQNE